MEFGVFIRKTDKRQVIMETWYDTHDTPNKEWSAKLKNCQTKAPSNKKKMCMMGHKTGTKLSIFGNHKHFRYQLGLPLRSNRRVFEVWFQNK